MKKLNTILLKAVLLCILIFNVFNVNAQKTIPLTITDSLLLLLKTEKNDSIILILLNKLTEECADEDILKYAEPQLKLAEKLKNKYYIALATTNIAYYYNLKGDVTKALDWNYKALNLFEKIKNNTQIANSLGSIGLIYKKQGIIDKALELYYKGLKIQEEIGDKAGIAYSLNNIAQIYKNQGNISQAIELYNKSILALEEINDKEGLANVYVNIGVINFNTGISKKNADEKEKYYNIAIQNYNKSLKIYKGFEDKQGVAIVLNNIGSIYSNRAVNNTNTSVNKVLLSEALTYFNQSLKIREEIGDKQGVSSTLKNIGNIYYLERDYTKAVTYSQRSFAIANELGYPETICGISEQLSKIYKTTGNYNDALKMFELFKFMSDSISNVETRKSGLKKQMQYDFEKKESIAKANQDKKDAITTQETQKQKIKTNSYLAGFFLMLVLCAIIYRGYKQKQKSNTIISKQKQNVELQKELVEKQKQLIEEKQKEILDSIRYAKRIQTALLPNEKYFEKNLKKRN